MIVYLATVAGSASPGAVVDKGVWICPTATLRARLIPVVAVLIRSKLPIIRWPDIAA